MYNLLLVDDEERTLAAIEKNVGWESCGIGRVYTATSMGKALQILQEEKIDILATDIEMPNGSGLDLLARVREDNAALPCIFLTCHAEFSYLQSAIRLQSADYILKPVDYGELEKALRRMLRSLEAAGDDCPGDAVANARLEQEMLAESRDIVKEIKEYVRGHMLDSLSVQEIAEALHFHPRYLTRVFKQKTGIGIQDYITGERVRAAKRLLAESNLSIKLIGEMVGYGDNAYFARVFKNETGVSPSQFRHNVQNR